MANTTLNAAFLNEIKDLETFKKEIDEQIKAMKAQVKAEMKTQGLKSVMVDGIKVTYNDSVTVTTLDTSRIKKEMPEIYEEFGKTRTEERLTIR